MEFLKNFPDINFIPGHYFMYSPSTKSITYDSKRLNTHSGKLALIHEVGHARLGHRIYKYDMELIKIEMDAWDFARQLAPQLGMKIDEVHIARCIDSYDAWLTKRATCPDCNNFSLQHGRDTYTCFICGAKWKVNERKDRRVKRSVVSRWPRVSQT